MSARDVLADWIADVACPLGFEHETGKSDFSYADAILAALDAAGYAVVPRDPTADMLVEGNLVIARNRLFATDIYKAMVQAAKETP